MVKKTRTERLIEQEYKKILQKMKNKLGNNTTFSSDLDRTGREMFGIKFKGVFPSDKIPKLSKLQPYAILNLDHSKGPGSHWIAVAFDQNKIIVYDSFGRKAKKIIPSIYNMYGKGSVINTDNDVEQISKETNCGQRSLAWLKFHDNNGPDESIMI